MKGILRRKPSPGLVISLIALFVSLGGVSYGVATGSIDSREIKNNTVSSRDLRNNSAGTADIRNGSLLRGDFKSGQLPAGPAGARGPDGPAGPAGRDGFGTLAYPFGSLDVPATGDPESEGSAVLPCPNGTYPTGGDGYVTADGDPDTLVEGVIREELFAFEGSSPVGWLIVYDNGTATPVDVYADVACANANTVQSKSEAKRRLGAGARRLR